VLTVAFGLSGPVLTGQGKPKAGVAPASAAKIPALESDKTALSTISKAVGGKVTAVAQTVAPGTFTMLTIAGWAT